MNFPERVSDKKNQRLFFSFAGGAFLNQFKGFIFRLYLIRSSFPTSNPPDQNTISMSIKLTEEAIIFVFVGKLVRGNSRVAPKNTPEKIIKNIPSLTCRFFFT